MDDEVLEFFLILPLVLAVVAINSTIVEIISSQINTLENFNESRGMTPFEYVIDNASGNVYPEVFCGG